MSDVTAEGFRQWEDDGLLVSDTTEQIDSMDILCWFLRVSILLSARLLYENLDQMATKDLSVFKMGVRLGNPYLSYSLLL